MRRGHVKVLLALGFTILVAGTIFFGLGRSQGSSNAIRATDPTAPSQSTTLDNRLRR